jgi:tetratricopeptide (TPR) repeat protein
MIEQQKGKEEALKYLHEIEPNSEWAEFKNPLFVKMAQYYGELGNKTRQQMMLEKAVIADPTNEDSRFSLAYNYADKDNQNTYLLALQQYRLLLEQNPKNTSALNNIALLYKELGLEGEHDKFLHLAMEQGSAHAKGNHIINLVEKGFFVDAQNLIKTLSVKEKNEERILDAIRHLDKAREIQSENLNKLTPLLNTYKKLIGNAISKPEEPSKIIGVWKSGNNSMEIEVDSKGKITGSYSIKTASGLGDLLLGLTKTPKNPTIKSYSVSGNFDSGVADILCIGHGGTLFSSEMLSLRLFPSEEKLEGFIWNSGNMPEIISFSK